MGRDKSGFLNLFFIRFLSSLSSRNFKELNPVLAPETQTHGWVERRWLVKSQLYFIAFRVRYKEGEGGIHLLPFLLPA